MLLGPTEIKRPGMWGFGEVQGYPVTGSISSPYGPRVPFLTPYGWTGDFHNAIDIQAPKGTPIYMPAPGKVTASYKDGAGGQTVVVRFTDGTGAMFVHMEGIQVWEGMELQRGSWIGGVGTSGMSTGDHLHFSLLKYVYDAPSWYPADAFIDPLTVSFTATVPNSEMYIPPTPVDFVTAKDYAVMIRSYIDQGVPLPAFASMIDTLIGMLDE